MRRLHVSDPDPEGLDEIVRTLAGGGVVCLPTDTLYGLAVDAASEGAIERLYRLKGRPPVKPVILLVDSLETARQVSDPPPGFDRIAAHFWPGPITFILPAIEGISAKLTAGTGTIGLRWPDAPLPVRVVRALGRPITSTSANRSGMPEARSADRIAAELAGVDLVVDQGPLEERQASTLVDLTTDPPELVREGPVSWDRLSRFFGGHLRRRSA